MSGPIARIRLSAYRPIPVEDAQMLSAPSNLMPSSAVARLAAPAPRPPPPREVPPAPPPVVAEGPTKRAWSVRPQTAADRAAVLAELGVGDGVTRCRRVDGCRTTKLRVRGLCDNCYQHASAARMLDLYPRVAPPPAPAETRGDGVSRCHAPCCCPVTKLRSRGLCETHYQRARLDGLLDEWGLPPSDRSAAKRSPPPPSVLDDVPWIPGDVLVARIAAAAPPGGGARTFAEKEADLRARVRALDQLKALPEVVFSVALLGSDGQVDVTLEGSDAAWIAEALRQRREQLAAAAFGGWS